VDYKLLSIEIATVTYNGMTDAETLAELIASNKQRNRSSVSGNEILEAIDPAALSALTGDALVKVMSIIGMDSVDPFGNAAQIFVDAFGAGSQTVTDLATIRTETVSRAEVIGINPIELSEQIILTARTGSW